MKLNCKIAWLKKIKERGGTDFSEPFRWRSDDQFAEIDTEKCSDADIALIKEVVKESGERGSQSVLRKIEMLLKLKVNLTGAKIGSLDMLAQALRDYISVSEHKWLFKEHSDGCLIPWYVSSIAYFPYDKRTEQPAHTLLKLVAARHGKKIEASIRWTPCDLGTDVVTCLKDEGYYLETAEAVSAYHVQMEHYKAIQPHTGKQFQGCGFAFETNSWSAHYSVLSLERDGSLARLVMDDTVDEKGEQKAFSIVSASLAYWSDQNSDLDTETVDHGEKTVIVPTHPYVNVFDLERHSYWSVHTSNLKPYAYDPTLIDKLILPLERKDLISILVAGADVQLEDIVRGKTGGIIVICTGPPGTGKTLSAEVFSELVKRPLYRVQCSQLGTSEIALEKTLSTVLTRSSRWNSILLIDEADVYVHERGEDIQQNAIVGVFLRLLENYRGVLFMTSNRDTIIDDAIMSRATAWIQYDYPEPKALVEIWRVLSTNYEVELSAAEIDELCKAFPKISGRSIKNLLRLGRLLALKKNCKVDVKLIQYVSQFIELDGKRKSKISSAIAVGR